ncbi:MAG: hypothetical protein JXB49_10625 [Bacteroidales bacterium]|nr:hypothetical protein [Bacteroidales bacterium]
MVPGVRLTVILLLFSYLFYCPVFSQTQLMDPDAAQESFQKRDYLSAYLTYSYLLDDYPKDAKYNYYTGICLYYLNHSYEKAVEYLSFAARYDVPADVYLYLGKLHHNGYRFDEAIKYFEKFNALAGKKAVKSAETSHLIDMARNGKSTIKNRTHLVATLKDTILLQDIAYASKATSKITTFDTKGSGKDLRILSGSLPAFDNLNTKFDEDFAWYDESTRTLYFSSKGHNSIGGYDAFFVTLKDNNTWSDVVNMGFPINSPFDDIIYKKDEKLMLATNRKLPLNSNFQEYEISRFSLAKTSVSDDSIQFYADLKYPVTNSNQAKNGSKIGSPEKKLSFENKEMEETYDDYIKQALKLQFKADSLMREAHKRRTQLKTTTLQTERTQLFREIRLLEAESAQLQSQADALYVKAGNMENDSSPSSSVIPSTTIENKYIELDTIINDIKIYHYKTEKIENLPPKVEEAENVQEKPEPKNIKEPEITETNTTNNQIPDNKVVTNFKILPSSSYSSSNPIPINETLPNGLVYKIQLGVFSKPLDNNYFGGIFPVCGEELKDRGLLKYYAGIFSNYNAAGDALSQIKALGFADAFIVSFYDGNKVSMERAIELEAQE